MTTSLERKNLRGKRSVRKMRPVVLKVRSFLPAREKCLKNRCLPCHRRPGWPVDGRLWDEGAVVDASFLRELPSSRSAMEKETGRLWQLECHVYSGRHLGTQRANRVFSIIPAPRPHFLVHGNLSPLTTHGALQSTPRFKLKSAGWLEARKA